MNDITEQPTIRRPKPHRAKPRPDAPREETRTAPREERLQRRRRKVDDRFAIDLSIVPRGYVYQWKRASVYGQPDVQHQVDLRENGWRPVPSVRHPNMMPDGATGAIEKDGMVLMERPEYLDQEARDEDYNLARAQLDRKNSQLGVTPPGTIPGSREHPSARANTKISTSRGPSTFEK